MEQWPPPLDPTEHVAREQYPASWEFLHRQVNMQFADLRVLFRLPVEELDPNVGCNLTTAAMMLNVVSGCSVWFFHTEKAQGIRAEEERCGHPLSRRRFIGFVEKYWPQIPPEPAPATVASRLYDVRNSLAHTLGVSDEPEDENPSRVSLGKPRSLSLDDVVMHLERNEIHPLAVPVIEGDEAHYVVHLAGFYWALHKMLRAALRDRPDEIEAWIQRLVVPEVEETIDAS
jgi:hypothetical protein